MGQKSEYKDDTIGEMVMNKLSWVGVILILILRNLIINLKQCCYSFTTVFTRLRKLKNPEKKFKDINEFIKLISNDEEEETPDILSDEEVKRIVVGGKGEQLSGGDDIEDHYEDSMGMMDMDEDDSKRITDGDYSYSSPTKESPTYEKGKVNNLFGGPEDSPSGKTLSPDRLEGSDLI